MSYNWNEVALVDLKNQPFRNNNGIEINLLDYLFNQINLIVKQQELSQKNSFEKFRQSRCLICLDSVNISNEDCSLLDTLIPVSEKHPFILINCSVDSINLFSLALHADFQRLGYILPIFGQLTPIDPVYVKEKYGIKFYEFLNGEVDTLSISDLKDPDKVLVDDILRRYSYLECINDVLRFVDNHIEWLGVKSKKFKDLLNHLYSSNRECFDPQWAVNTFGVSESELNRYSQSSMLFSKEGDQIRFRFLKSNLFLKIQSKLYYQFEEKMIEAEALQVYRKTKAGESSFNEYHNIGRVFENTDRYKLKLLAAFKKKIAYHFPDFLYPQQKSIILIDNGYESGMYFLLKKYFPSKKVTRILNCHDHPIIYPFDEEINSSDNAIVVIDLINTGNFLSKVVKMVKDMYKAEIFAVYTFVINGSIATNQISSAPIFSYVEKKLEKSDEIKDILHATRDNARDNFRYKSFWQIINNVGSIDGKIQQNVVRKGGSIFYTLYRNKIFVDVKNPSFETTDFNVFLGTIITSNNINKIIFLSENSKSFFHSLNDFSKYTVNSVIFNSKSKTFSSQIFDSDRILILDVTLLSGHNIEACLTELDKKEYHNRKVFVAVFFEKRIIDENVIGKIDSLVNLHPELKGKIFKYYTSNIPFYKIDKDSINSSRIKNSLEKYKK